MVTTSETYQPLEAKIIDNQATLLKTGNLADVILVSGGLVNSTEHKAHKALLAAQSPVFAAMFENDFEEKRENKVRITDIAGDTCQELVRYIYTGQVGEMDRLALELMEAADKVGILSWEIILYFYIFAFGTPECFTIVVASSGSLLDTTTS